MKINNSTPSLGLPGGAAALSRSVQTPQASAAGNMVEAQVATSTPHTQELQKAVANTPVVNIDRVKEIKQAIAEGRFKIDPEKIADSLLENVKQMLGNRSQA